MSLIGLHVSDILDIMDVIKAFNKHTKIKNLNFFQIFVSATAKYSSEKYVKVLKYIKKHNIYIIVHASYSINLARRWSDTEVWVQQFIGEIQISAKINAFGIVVHTGKQLDLSMPEALNNMYTALLFVHEKTLDHQSVKILLETPSGQGTETLVRIEEFCKFMNKFYTHPNQNIKNRFGICIDTCHVFAAGHDIRTKTDMNAFFGIIDTIVGINKIKLFHINDSKKELGSNLDRHDNIGKGEIGKSPISEIVRFGKKLEIPMILETPSDGIYNDLQILFES